MKEVNALKILSETRARNINHVIEALPVGTSMWMITEYCGGGSVATLVIPVLSFAIWVWHANSVADETHPQRLAGTVDHSYSQRGC